MKFDPMLTSYTKVKILLYLQRCLWSDRGILFFEYSVGKSYSFKDNSGPKYIVELVVTPYHQFEIQE